MPGTPAPAVIRDFIAAGRDDAGAARRLTLRRHGDVTKPVIAVGTGTCGFGAGAAWTLAAIREWLAQRGIDTKVFEVGCVGLCVEKPLVDVQLPKRTRVSYSKVTLDVVGVLLDGMMNETIDTRCVLGQHRSEGLRPWPDVPYLDEF